ncbi:MAG: alpha/beta hydrolase, partial [Ilumatobacteraceae bacterium]
MLDPAAKNVLDLLAAAGGPALQDQTPAEARTAFAGMAMLSGEGADVASVADRTIAGVPCIVVTPHGTGPFPVLVWIHGGGWVIGSAEESVATCRTLAAGAGCIVVSVGYRLAPEHPAPAAVDDCLAVTGWLLEHASELGGDGSRVAVGGDSAGGNLSALTALEFGPRLRLQLLVYPAVDLTLSHPSITENAEGYLLTKAGMQWFVGHYLSGSGMQATDPRLSPLFAA